MTVGPLLNIITLSWLVKTIIVPSVGASNMDSCGATLYIYGHADLKTSQLVVLLDMV